MSLDVRCPEHLAAVRAFADSLGDEARQDLERRLAYLGAYGSTPTVCRLFQDFAPHSFRFSMFRREGDALVFWFDGGLIYHGPGSSGGAFPTLAVTVDENPRPRWSVHT
jgi:hypothetical protein